MTQQELDELAACEAMLDAQPMPTEGRLWLNPATGQIEPLETMLPEWLAISLRAN